MADKRFIPERDIINQARRDVERLKQLLEPGILGEHQEFFERVPRKPSDRPEGSPQNRDQKR